jgi:hypothetical protein
VTDHDPPARRGVFVVAGLFALIALGFLFVIWLRSQAPDEPPRIPPPPAATPGE